MPLLTAEAFYFWRLSKAAGITISALQVKQAVVGYSRADKKQVIYMVSRLLCMKTAPKPDDAADAFNLDMHAKRDFAHIKKRG